MTPRTRRFVLAITAIVIALFVGRWSVEFIAERWWAATISSEAARAVSQWRLIGLGFDAAAILVASVWFVVHALLVARTIASVQVAHQSGSVRLREVVPTRVLVGAGVIAGVLLGLIAGSGAHDWRNSALVAWQGVHYGVTDPVLGEDLGVFVAQVPVWDLLHQFAGLLALLGLGFSLAAYLAIGAVQRRGVRFWVHDVARRHIGVLLSAVALVFSVGYLLAPYHLAMSGSPSLTASLTADAALARVRVDQLLCGIAVATAALTLWWALGGQMRALLVGWILLAGGAVVDRVLVPALIPDGAASPRRVAQVRALDQIAWGIRFAVADAADTLPPVTAVWDPSTLARRVMRRDDVVRVVSPVSIPDSPAHAGWIGIAAGSDDSGAADVFALRDDSVNAGGSPLGVPVGINASRPGSRATLRVEPDGRAWSRVRDGVSSASPLRRLLLAWARQEPGMLTQDPNFDAVDWHLDPAERADAVLPMFTWLPADAGLVDGRLTWIVQGLVVHDRFPMATRVSWAGDPVAGIAPGLIATVDAVTGRTTFFLDPAADSLASSWSRAIGPVIQPASAIPVAVRSALRYSGLVFEAQLAVLASATWDIGTRSPDTGAALAPTWINSSTPALQGTLDVAGRNLLATIVTAYRDHGLPFMLVQRHDPAATATESRAALRQQWNRTPVAQHLRDSVTAAGDSVVYGAIRWWIGPGGEAAWQPWFARQRQGGISLLWVATAMGTRIGGARTPELAWQSTEHAATLPDADQPNPAASMQLAREWMARADSALRRGDMTAFGRAFEALRSILEGNK